MLYDTKLRPSFAIRKGDIIFSDTGGPIMITL